MAVLLQLRELRHVEQHEEILAMIARTATEIWGSECFGPVTAPPSSMVEQQQMHSEQRMLSSLPDWATAPSKAYLPQATQSEPLLLLPACASTRAANCSRPRFAARKELRAQK